MRQWLSKHYDPSISRTGVEWFDMFRTEHPSTSINQRAIEHRLTHLRKQNNVNRTYHKKRKAGEVIECVSCLKSDIATYVLCAICNEKWCLSCAGFGMEKPSDDDQWHCYVCLPG